ncbi:hypothetical protein [Brevundimonas pondensis]|uniref:Alpha/beta hydrolase n=1 Tax=Brevundimonas pondensis TaxID=2774189 RepID=A0ABX7SPX6_9CAUL|nr:hypothetical protein [Brevundimonas pondensis]QTC89638.1 hypothetical protein IFE19_04055 [Brevundimonas pondensis]
MGGLIGTAIMLSATASRTRAASTDKSLHVVEGANHMDLYDGEKYVAEAVSVLAPFFTARLSA